MAHYDKQIVNINRELESTNRLRKVMSADQEQMKKVTTEAKQELDKFSNTIKQQLHIAKIDYISNHMKAYIETCYLNNKTAKQY